MVGLKKSGIEWVGDIPMDWDVRRGKDVFSLMNRPIIVNETVTAFRDGQVIQRKKRRTEGFTESLQETGYQGVKRGDLVIHGMDAFAGAIGVSEDDGKATPVYLVLSPKNENKIDVRYYAYLMRAYSIVGYIESMAKGIRVRSTDFKYKTFAETPLLNPSYEEQKLIADYLDVKVAEIDSIIEGTGDSIKELKELKTSRISELVTMGESTPEEVLDTEIDYLGQIPANWTVSRLKAILWPVSVKNHGEEEVLSLYRDYGVVPKNSRDDNWNVTSLDTDSYKLVTSGQLVMNKMKAWQGSMAVSKIRGIVSPAYYVFDVKSPLLDLDFLHYSLRAKRKIPAYRRLSAGMREGQWDLGIDDFLTMKIAFPSLSEQKKIVEKINAFSPKIDGMISDKNDLINELIEYKKSLIYEVVTGKQKV